MFVRRFFLAPILGTICAAAACSSSDDIGGAAPDVGMPEAGVVDGGTAAPADSSAGTPSDGGGSTADGGGLTFTTSAAPAQVAVTGTIVDATTDAPIEGATVKLGATTFTTLNTGGFGGLVAAGRPILTVSATGYVPLVRPIGTTSATPTIHVRLVPSQPASTVDASGATLTLAAGVTLTIPPDAYPSTTSITVTWLDATHLAGTSARPRYETADFVSHRLVGQLHVDVSTEPTAAATLTLPIPNGAPGPTLSPVDPTTGERGTPITPTSTTATTATYSLTHFTDWLQDIVDDTGDWTASDPCTLSDGTTAQAGDPIPSGSTVTSGSVVSPNGAELAATGPLTVVSNSDGSAEADENEDEPNGEVAVEVPPSAPAPADNKPKLQIRTKTAVLGVRGTVFRVALHPCPGQDARSIDFLEVSEGVVDVTSKTTQTVQAGQEATACDGCADPLHPSCCDVTNCATGCCTADQKCQPGTTDDACGTQAATCAVCDVGTSACVAQQCGLRPPCATCAGNHTQLESGPCTQECGPNPPSLKDGCFGTQSVPGVGPQAFGCSCIDGTWQCTKATIQ